MNRCLRSGGWTAGLVALLLIPMLLAGCLRRQVDPERTEVFMWNGAGRIMEAEPAVFDGMMRFAARQGIVPYASGIRDSTALRRYLTACERFGLRDVWVEIGPRTEATAEQFATDPAQRQATLERFRGLARVFTEFDLERIRITMFDEAPLGAFASVATDSGRSYRADLQDFRAHGPQGYAQMHLAITEEVPEAEVGVFLHHPHNASPQTAGSYSIIDEFMARAADHGATPDFIYSDVYRGYFNRGYGTEATNAYITDVVRHIREVADRHGADAYQLGQVHTIKLGYTPSRRQIDTNVKAMLAGAPDGIGWYWPNYASTNRVKGPDGAPAQPTGYDVSFDPFVPNSWGRTGPAGSLFATSRDRFMYSYLRALEATDRLDPDTRFDLWIYGHDFDHAEHTVALQTRDSSWVTLGSINPQRDADGYVDGARPEHMYSYDGRWHAVVFHGLRRSRFLAGDSAQTTRVRFTSADTSDASRITAAYVMPYRATRNYATEAEVTRFIEEQPRWVAVNSLARHVRPFPDTLRPGTSSIFTLTGDRPLVASDEVAWRERMSP